MFSRLLNFVNVIHSFTGIRSGIFVTFRHRQPAPCPCCHGRHFELVQKSFRISTRKTSAIFGNQLSTSKRETRSKINLNVGAALPRLHLENLNKRFNLLGI
jgi:hypothetical protein